MITQFLLVMLCMALTEYPTEMRSSIYTGYQFLRQRLSRIPAAFVFAAFAWTMDLEGDRLLAASIPGTASAGTSETHPISSTASNAFSNGDPIGTHETFNNNSDDAYTFGSSILSDLVAADAFTLFLVTSINAYGTPAGTHFYEVPGILQTNGGQYWGLGVSDVGIRAGIFDGTSFKDLEVAVPLNTPTIITFRLRAGVLSLRKNIDDWQTIPSSNIALLSNFLANYTSEGRGNVDYARLSISAQAFSDNQVSSLLENIAAIYGITLTPPETIYGFLGAGQSLSIGARSGNIELPAVTVGTISNHQMLGDLFSTISSAVTPSSSWVLTALQNPMRGELGATNNSGWPLNAWDESPAPAFAYRLLSSAAPTIKGFHSQTGQDGADITVIEKGGSGNAYQAGLDEATRAKQLYSANSKTLKYGAILFTHGESDYSNATYTASIQQLITDYNVDLQAITGQSEPIPMIATQPSAGWPTFGIGSQLQYQAMLDLALIDSRFILAGPKYQFDYATSDFHLDPAGTRDMGYLYADVYALVRQNGTFLPLYPTSQSRATVSGKTVLTVNFSLPSGALQFDTATVSSPHQTEHLAWANGKGFEVEVASSPVTINSATIVGNSVELALDSLVDPADPIIVSYAHTIDSDNIPRRGNLRTSTGHWCVHFMDPFKLL